MFAGVWGAYKALGLAWKVGIPCLVVLVLLGSIWAWNARQQSIGEARQELKQQVELTKQGQDATAEFSRQSDIKDRNVDDVIAINAQLVSQINEIQKELDRYAKKKVCPLDTDAVRIVNDLARVLNDAPTERVPPTSEAARRAAVEAEAPLTVTDTAALVQRIADLTEREALTDAAHRQLSEYVTQKYEQEMRFYTGVQEDQ